MTLESENIKKLAANNIRLKSEYQQNQLQIQELSNDVETLSSQLEISRTTFQKLKVKTDENLAYIDQIENINGNIFKSLLEEFKDNINDLDGINKDLMI